MMLHYISLILSIVISSSTPLHPDEVNAIGEPILLTNPEQFLKAGESYFDPATKRIIFQAIEHPAKGQEPDTDYGMYLLPSGSSITAKRIVLGTWLNPVSNIKLNITYSKVK